MNNRTILLSLGIVALNISAQERKPNVIIIYTDDQGTLDMNCFGAPDLSTPNMDALARNGVRFSQFYGSAVSSVSRASLLTGQFSKHNGVTGNCGVTGLKPERQTIAERLRDNGYRTACIGKWHLGSDYDYRPTNQGFDYFWGFLGGCVDSYSHFFYWDGPNKHDLWRNNTEIHEEGKFLTEETLKESEKFIQEGDTTKPFFIYWAINIPHYPLQPKKKWLDYYSSLPNPRRMYAAFVSTFDDYLGKLITFLKSKNLIENTIIILQSDNGHSTEMRTFGGGGYCGDYRGAKFSLFEGGIRVPAIISWKGHITEGETRHQVAANIDWYPTILDYCNINYTNDDIDGRSLRPIIQDDKKPSVNDVLHFDVDGQWAVRQGEWKLIYNVNDVKQNGKGETIKGVYLSNLEKDSAESVNLAEKYPQMVEELQKLRNEYLSKLNEK